MKKTEGKESQIKEGFKFLIYIFGKYKTVVTVRGSWGLKGLRLLSIYTYYYHRQRTAR